MKNKLKYLLLYALILCSLICFAQQNNAHGERSRTIDSLHSLLKTLNSTPAGDFVPTVGGEAIGNNRDTTYINTLNNLAWELKNNNLDTAIILSTQALKLSMIIFKAEGILSPLGKVRERCIAKSYNKLGVFNSDKANYSLSLANHFKALKIWESLKDKKGTSASFGNIGIVYRNQGDYPKALDYYFKALKMVEELRDKAGIARQLGNIGIVYWSQGDYPKALDYYFKALKMNEALGNKNKIAIWLGNIGNVYHYQDDYPKALDYFLKALKIDEDLGNKNGIAGHIGNIGNVYKDQGDYPKALNYYFKALKMNEELGNKNEIAINLGNIGSLYTITKKYNEAEESLQKALALSTEINAVNLIKAQQQYLSELYEQTNQPAKALEHYKKYIAAKDSIFNEENTKKTVRSEMNFDFEKKQAIEKAEQEKQNVIAEQEKQKQKAILILVSCFLILVVVFASFMFNRWRVTQKQKRIIEKQKEKILDSITYAQLIQQSILMEETEIQQYLPDLFIYFQPKDIVSGDFYWFSEIVRGRESEERRTENSSQLLSPSSSPPHPSSSLKNTPLQMERGRGEVIIIAAIDCTGHGVPGAFMSMIGNTLLNQIVNEKQITIPSEILRLLNLGVYEALHQNKEGALSSDGMDIALCCIDYKNNQIQYAGAQNPLYILTDNKLTIINADRQTIGGGGMRLKKTDPLKTEYTNHIIPIKKGMSIYLFSDGYMDQFGGSERRKFGIQKFKELVLNNQHLSMKQQKEIFVDAHETWKGNTTQIDDVLVMGLRL